MAKRTPEFVLGLIGGIFGIFSGIFALAVGGIGSAVGASGAGTIAGLGWAALAFSVLGIVGSVIVRTKAKRGGWMMIVAAVGGTISVSFFFILPCILLGIAGIMGVVRKDEQPEMVAVAPMPVMNEAPKAP